MRLSAVMIVKNEEPVIDRCLKSLDGFDEIVVVDTGSEDRTVELASLYSEAKVITDYKWNDDFAEARNYALSHATGDWCMQIDADHTLMTPIDEVRWIVEHNDRQGEEVLSISLTHGPSGASHNGAWLFKRLPGIEYVGRIHEVLNRVATVQTTIEQVYDKSPSHMLDPDRNLRILLKSDKTPRTLFYLGREQFERRDYKAAVDTMGQYLTVAHWLPELCEAHLTLARCHWALQNGDLARFHCLEAVRNNPMFKEALLFMGELHYEPWRSRWVKLAAAATNEEVLFVRSA